jgi:hypothetical protein
VSDIDIRKQKWFSHCKAYSESGKSMEVYCNDNNLVLTTFKSYWKEYKAKYITDIRGSKAYWYPLVREWLGECSNVTKSDFCIQKKLSFPTFDKYYKMYKKEYGIVTYMMNKHLCIKEESEV